MEDCRHSARGKIALDGDDFAGGQAALLQLAIQRTNFREEPRVRVLLIAPDDRVFLAMILKRSQQKFRVRQTPPRYNV
jgi:hypothetical protein